MNEYSKRFRFWLGLTNLNRFISVSAGVVGVVGQISLLDSNCILVQHSDLPTSYLTPQEETDSS